MYTFFVLLASLFLSCVDVAPLTAAATTLPGKPNLHTFNDDSFYSSEMPEDRVPTPYPAHHIAIIIITAKTGYTGDLLRLLQHSRELSRETGDCLTYDICKSSEVLDQFILYEVWTSKEAHNEHLHNLAKHGLVPEFERLVVSRQKVLATKID